MLPRGGHSNLLLSLEVQAGILGSTTVLINEVSAKGLLDLDKVGLEMGCGEAVRKLLDCRRETIIEFIA